jgi:hypothetical protein
MSKVNWKEMLIEAFKETGDNFDNLKTTLSKEELETEFDSSFGYAQGEPFTAWGDNYVYFPIVYDGAEWVGFAPRNVCDIKTGHWGGE